MSSTPQCTPHQGTIINRLNLIPYHLLHIPGLFLIFLGIYAIYCMVDPMGAAKKLDIAFFGYFHVIMAGYLAIGVGFFLCVAWWHMRGKQWMTTEEAERQRREMAGAEGLRRVQGDSDGDDVEQRGKMGGWRGLRA